MMRLRYECHVIVCAFMCACGGTGVSWKLKSFQIKLRTLYMCCVYVCVFVCVCTSRNMRGSVRLLRVQDVLRKAMAEISTCFFHLFFNILFFECTPFSLIAHWLAFYSTSFLINDCNNDIIKITLSSTGMKLKVANSMSCSLLTSTS